MRFHYHLEDRSLAGCHQRLALPRLPPLTAHPTLPHIMMQGDSFIMFWEIWLMEQET